MNQPREVVLIGAGIMSATLAVLLKKLNPSIKIKIYEVLESVATESSSALNNAGTGHSGYCELNYTPRKNGAVDISKAVDIARQFMQSREFWASLVEEGYISDPKLFIQSTPHYSFVNTPEDISFLRDRFLALKDNPLFQEIVYSEDFHEISNWLPIVMAGRDPKEKVACTKMIHGTDVNFESLTKQIFDSLINRGEVDLFCSHMVRDLKKEENKWLVEVKNFKTKEVSKVSADFVFIGAGGGSILLLEKSKIPESNFYGGFPVGGEWLICTNPNVVSNHKAKVYGQAPIGTPPMSTPHLDTRIINGESKLLFGPFAIFSTKFLKHGSYLDLFKSLQLENLGFMTQAGFRNLDLTKYLLEQAALSKEDKVEELRKYFPKADINDWSEESAGQRVQIIKKEKNKGGILEFGTEIVSSSDGSLVALLGASPGASTSVHIMLSVLEKCFSETKSNQWESKLEEIIPCLKSSFSREEVKESLSRTSKILKI